MQEVIVKQRTAAQIPIQPLANAIMKNVKQIRSANKKVKRKLPIALKVSAVAARSA